MCVAQKRFCLSSLMLSRKPHSWLVSEALLALLEVETVSSVVLCGTDQLLCCLIYYNGVQWF